MKEIIILISFFVYCWSQNTSEVLYLNPPNEQFILGEAAVGGMISTSIIVILAAILRILQFYRQRRYHPQHQQNLHQQFLKDKDEKQSDTVLKETIKE